MCIEKTVLNIELEVKERIKKKFSMIQKMWSSYKGLNGVVCPVGVCLCEHNSNRQTNSE